MRATCQRSGTLSRILIGPQEAGWLRADWEDIDPIVEGRPDRRCYRLTPEAAVAANAELAALHAKPRPGDAGGAWAANATTFTPAPGW